MRHLLVLAGLLASLVVAAPAQAGRGGYGYARASRCHCDRLLNLRHGRLPTARSFYGGFRGY